jgi:hypothetical protein
MFDTCSGSDYTRIPVVSLTFDCVLSGTGQVSLPTITVEGRNIYTYRLAAGVYSFWRFLFEIPLQSLEMRVRYRVNGGATLCFVVPARDQNFRWATHSCPGVSCVEGCTIQVVVQQSNADIDTRFLRRGEPGRFQGVVLIGV